MTEQLDLSIFENGVDCKRDSRLDSIPCLPDTDDFHLQSDKDGLLTITGNNAKGRQSISYKMKQGADKIFETIELTHNGDLHEYATGSKPGTYYAKVNGKTDNDIRLPDSIISNISKSMQALPKAYIAQQENSGKAIPLDNSKEI